MAHDPATREQSGPSFDRPNGATNGATFGDSEIGRGLYRAVEALASLKLTVVLFALAVFLVYAGTLAQAEIDIYWVLKKHFYPWITWFRVQTLVPESFFPGLRNAISEKIKFPFPGGALIGSLMFVNLIAAHSIRFKIQSSGSRLWGGLGVIGLGALVTFMVIRSGSNPDGFQTEPVIEWDFLWQCLKFGLGALWVGMASSLLKIGHERRLERWGVIGLTTLIGVALVYLFWQGDDAKLNDSAMRILWQLIKGALAGLMLLGGCILVFKKRAGIVLMHAGVGLLMFSELFVTLKNKEAQMPIFEGETVNFVQDARHPELAVVDTSPKEHDRVTVIPGSRLRAAKESEEVIDHADLPFRIEVTAYLQNSGLIRRTKTDADLQGAGQGWDVQEVDPGKGTDVESKFDVASAYVELIDKKSSKNLGRYLFSMHLREQDIEVGGKTYSVALRAKRIYKPYSIHLIDVRADTYLGTGKAKNYASTFQLVDPSRNVKKEVSIRMNEPLRYAGETFYQSGYVGPPDVRIEQSTFQIVTNQGWMIPYVACMIIMTGMLSHFWLILLRFLNRRAAGGIPVGAIEPPRVAGGDSAAAKRAAKSRKIPQSFDNSALPGLLNPNRAGVWFPAVVCLLAGGILVGLIFRKPVEREGMQVGEFAKLPVVSEARSKPLDSFARNNLRAISEGETAKDGAGDTQPAIVWLLDVVTRPREAAKYRVFRIENLEALRMLGLPRRKGFRYTFNEVLNDKTRPVFAEQEEQLRKLREANKKHKPTIVQRKFSKLGAKLGRYQTIQRTFVIPPAEVKTSQNEFIRFLFNYRDTSLRVPLAVPNPGDEKTPWLPLSKVAGRHWARQLARANGQTSWDGLYGHLLRTPRDAVTEAIVSRMGEGLPPFQIEARYRAAIAQKLSELTAGSSVDGEELPEALALIDIFAAARGGDAAAFNAGIDKYNTLLANSEVREYDAGRLRFEYWVNRYSPYFICAILYVVAFVLTVLGWLGWARPLNRAAFGLVGLTFVVHTMALIARMYISGRWGVMVTNLYSSAIFIGWACCVFGLLFESVYRLGIGNVVASVAGFASLLIAHLLSFDGDTISVMQAVLDTNFWLATHVTTITLGYSATFVAGLLAAGYVIAGFCTPTMSKDVGRVLNRMMYGSLCFAIFFSLVGTVLGGLWADDSWGRFWGWDPKENGALIIVLWNALVLHARWGGLVKERGLAVLALGGNIVTAWSWFGVNMLNVGLHSYGEQEGTLEALCWWWIANLVVIGLGCAPKDTWWSFRKRGETNLEATA